MLRTILIRILFKVLSVEGYTRNLIPLADIALMRRPDVAASAQERLRSDFLRALATAYGIPKFVEMLYVQLVEKQREHMQTFDKGKREHQVASALYILWLIEQMREADALMNKKSARDSDMRRREL